MVFRMIHVNDSLLPRGKVWYLDFLGIYDVIYLFRLTTENPHLGSIRRLPEAEEFRRSLKGPKSSELTGARGIFSYA